MPLLTEITLLASDNGEGLVGETDDKIITFFSLGVVVFFVVAVILLSLLQGRLEKCTRPRGNRGRVARRDLHRECSRSAFRSM
jgi:hypothetical protein